MLNWLANDWYFLGIRLTGVSWLFLGLCAGFGVLWLLIRLAQKVAKGGRPKGLSLVESLEQQRKELEHETTFGAANFRLEAELERKRKVHQQIAEKGHVLPKLVERIFIGGVAAVLHYQERQLKPLGKMIEQERYKEAADFLLSYAREQREADKIKIGLTAEYAAERTANKFRRAGSLYFLDHPDLAMMAWHEAAQVRPSDWSLLLLLSHLEEKISNDIEVARQLAEKALKAAHDDNDRIVACFRAGEVATRQSDMAKQQSDKETEKKYLSEAFAHYVEIDGADPGNANALRVVHYLSKELADIAIEERELREIVYYLQVGDGACKKLLEYHPGDDWAQKKQISSLQRLGTLTGDKSFWLEAKALIEGMKVEGRHDLLPTEEFIELVEKKTQED